MFFSLVSNNLRHSNNSRHLIFNINAVDNLLRCMKMVKCLPEFEHLTVFLKNRNFISKIRRSKITDYAALRVNKCEFSVYTVRIFMKRTHVCAAQTTYFKLNSSPNYK